jgi:cation diffusion facilitator family transporter
MRDYEGIRKVLILTLLLHVLATLAQLAVGFHTRTLSLTADGLDAFFDGFSNVIGLIAISFAARPPDRDHPYGHRKYETMMALGIAMLLAVTTWELLEGALGRFLHPITPLVTIWSFAAVAFGILTQTGASVYEFRRGHELRSELLVADARHTAANTMVSVAVLLGLPFISRGYVWVDPALTVAVALVVARLGLDIVRDSFPVLVDRAPVEPERIADVVGTVDGVTSFHRIRSRGTSDDASVDLHVRVGAELPVARADAIADEVRDRLLAEVSGVSDVTVHVEPQRTEQATASEVFAAILNAAAARPVSIHEVWAYHEANGRASAEAHIGVAPDLSLPEADELVGRMESEILSRLPWLDRLHTHIEPAFRELRSGSLLPPDQIAPIQAAVRETIGTLPRLSQAGEILVHSTPEGLFVALDCFAARDLTVGASHALAHSVAEGIRQRVPDVVDVAVRMRPS